MDLCSAYCVVNIQYKLSLFASMKLDLTSKRHCCNNSREMFDVGEFLPAMTSNDAEEQETGYCSPAPLGHDTLQ